MMFTNFIDTNLDTSSMVALLASIVGILVVALGYLYNNQLKQHASILGAKDLIIVAKDFTIKAIQDEKKIAQDKLSNEQVYVKQSSIDMMSFMKDVNSSLIDLNKSSDKVLDLKPIIERSKEIIDAIESHQKKILEENQKIIISNQSKFIKDGRN